MSRSRSWRSGALVWVRFSTPEAKHESPANEISQNHWSHQSNIEIRSVPNILTRRLPWNNTFCHGRLEELPRVQKCQRCHSKARGVARAVVIGLVPWSATSLEARKARPGTDSRNLKITRITDTRLIIMCSFTKGYSIGIVAMEEHTATWQRTSLEAAFTSDCMTVDDTRKWYPITLFTSHPTPLADAKCLVQPCQMLHP